VNQLKMSQDGTEDDDDTQADKCYPRPDGQASGADGQMGFACAELPEEQAEAADRKSDTDQAQSRANPS